MKRRKLQGKRRKPREPPTEISGFLGFLGGFSVFSVFRFSRFSRFARCSRFSRFSLSAPCCSKRLLCKNRRPQWNPCPRHLNKPCDDLTPHPQHRANPSPSTTHPPCPPKRACARARSKRVRWAFACGPCVTQPLQQVEAACRPCGSRCTCSKERGGGVARQMQNGQGVEKS